MIFNPRMKKRIKELEVKQERKNHKTTWRSRLLSVMNNHDFEWLLILLK